MYLSNLCGWCHFHEGRLSRRWSGECSHKRHSLRIDQNHAKADPSNHLHRKRERECHMTVTWSIIWQVTWPFLSSTHLPSTPQRRWCVHRAALLRGSVQRWDGWVCQAWWPPGWDDSTPHPAPSGCCEHSWPVAREICILFIVCIILHSNTKIKVYIVYIWYYGETIPLPAQVTLPQ